MVKVDRTRVGPAEGNVGDFVCSPILQMRKLRPCVGGPTCP